MGRYIDYQDDADTCQAYVASPEGAGTRPAVLVAHQWSGQSDHERATADRLASLGYVGIAIDVYGKGRRGEPGSSDHSALLMPWLQDRAALRRRLMAAVDFAQALDGVDKGRIAIIGYCFGGLCALDVARTGTRDVRGAISVHGLLSPPALGAQPAISTSVLILHGWADPMAKPADVDAVAAELTGAGADWQLHAYGHAMHAFTAKHANDPTGGKLYDAAADRRSWQAAVAFLDEIFSPL